MGNMRPAPFSPHDPGRAVCLPLPPMLSSRVRMRSAASQCPHLPMRACLTAVCICRAIISRARWRRTLSPNLGKMIRKRSDIYLTFYGISIGILSALDKYLIFVTSYPIDASIAHRTVAVTSRPLTDLSFPYMAFRALPPDISIGMLRHHLRRHRAIEALMPLCRNLRPFGSQIIETYENFSSRAIWAVIVA